MRERWERVVCWGCLTECRTLKFAGVGALVMVLVVPLACLYYLQVYEPAAGYLVGEGTLGRVF